MKSTAKPATEMSYIFCFQTRQQTNEDSPDGESMHASRTVFHTNRLICSLDETYDRAKQFLYDFSFHLGTLPAKH
jgi:hypothetical protein